MLAAFAPRAYTAISLLLCLDVVTASGSACLSAAGTEAPGGCPATAAAEPRTLPSDSSLTETGDDVAFLQLHAIPARRRGAAGPLNRTARAKASKGSIPFHQLLSMSAPKQEDESNQTWCGYGVQNGFLQALTKPNSDSFLIDLTDALSQETSAVKFVVTAITVSGTYVDGQGYLTQYAYPAEETTSTIFELRRGADGVSVDAFRPLLDVRTSDDQSALALERGTGSGWFNTLPTYACDPQGILAAAAGIGEGNGPQLISMADVPALQSAGAQRMAMSSMNTSNATLAREMLGQPLTDRWVIDGADLLRQGFWTVPSVASASSYRLKRIKAFPQNFDVVAEFMMPEGLPLALGFSLVRLRENPMQPRKADERMLYFTMDYEDLGQHREAPEELPGESLDRQVSNIWRYDLGALPDQQIRIYVDPTVPKRWRKWFRLGIEAWNDAFSLIGKPKAVRAVLPEDSDWPKDYDIMDARYNTIAWTLSNQVVSMGIAKVDPRSGEILKSDITMSDGWVRSWLGDLDLLAPNLTHQISESRGYRVETIGEGRAGAPGPDGKTGGQVKLLELEGELQRELASGLGRRGHPGEGDWGKKVSLMALAGGQPLTVKQRSDMLGRGLRHIVTHETGHILGLRHNFKGSMAISYACTRDPACTAKQGLTASVMDYIPVNLPSPNPDGPPVHIFSPVLGAYDKLAIQYGYMDVPVEFSLDGTRNQQLLEVAKNAEAYDTCYDSDRIAGEDPACAAYDLTDDPIQYFEDQVGRLRLVQHHLLNASVRPGAPFTHYGHAVSNVLSLVERNALDAVRWIGGVSNSYTYRREEEPARAATRRVPAAVQRRAVQLLLQVLRPWQAGLLPPEGAYSFLVSGRMGQVSKVGVSRQVRSTMQYLLQNALHSSKLIKLQEQEELMSPRDTSEPPFSCGEFLGMLVAGVMGQALSAGPTMEWDLQRELVLTLGTLYRKDISLPDAVSALILHHLRKIHGEVESSLLQTGDSTDSLLREHLLSLRHLIVKDICDGDTSQTCQALSSTAPRSSTAPARRQPFRWLLLAHVAAPVLGLSLRSF